ncbi:MAG: sigma-70 family RNA polymerase sigma factor [Planctomycetota bacterium]|nr:sigma-70 family RNA polymerase sigma factor [Planctomycetota bacterium]
MPSGSHSERPPSPDGRGDADAIETAYAELRRIAAAYLRNERVDHTLQPTALVHEAYLRLAESRSTRWSSAGEFRAMAAGAMRRILIDHARRRGAEKRGGGWLRVALNESLVGGPDSNVDIISLDEALSALAELDERKARVVELRFFGGMTLAEIADTIGISPKTVEADWYMARAWLYSRLDRAEQS